MSAPTVTRQPVPGDVPACESCRIRPAVTTVTVGTAAPFAVCQDCTPRPGEVAAPGAVDELDVVSSLGAAVAMAGGRVRRQYQAPDGWAVAEFVPPVMAWLVPVVTIVGVPVASLSAWFATGSPVALVGTGVGLAVILTAIDSAVSR